MWVTFAVHGVAGHQIRVKLRRYYAPGTTPVPQPVLSAIAFDPYNSRRTTMGYDGDGNLTQVVDPLNNTTVMGYNSDGTMATVTDAKTRETQFFYEDAHKNLTRILDANSGTTQLTYDLNGNVLTVEDPMNRTSTMTYDGKNRLLTTTDNLGHETTMTYYANGTLNSVTDGLGRVTHFFYTPTSRLQRIHDALGQDTYFGYDSAGNLLNVTDPRSNVTTMAYDLAGRMVQVNQPDTQQVEYVFNAINRLVSITAPNGNQATTAINLTGSQNALRNPSMEIRDPFDGVNDRPRYWGYAGSADLPAGRVSTQAHSGTHSLAVSENASGFAQGEIPVYAGGRYLASYWVSKAADSVSASYTLTATLRDFYSNPQTEPASPVPTTLDGSTSAWTQAAPTRVDVPGDTQATRLHPPLQSLNLNAVPNGSSVSYFDDATLNLLSTCFEYDGENLREVGSPDGGRTRMDYDRFGRLTQMTDPIGRTVTMTYDGLDRLLTVTDSMGQTVSYAYDQTGQLVSVQDPRNQVTAYSYDLLDRLHQITYPDSTQEVFTYNAGSDLLTYTDNMSRQRSFGYDGAGRLSGIVYSDNTSIALTYDAVSNLLRRVERNGDVQLFSYDVLNRQNGSSYTPAGSSTPQWALSSAFDANGNRTQLETGATVTGSTVNGVFQTQTTAGGTNIWSVPSGGFDAMDRLTSFQDGSGQITSMQYDVEGRRVGLSQPNGCTTTASYDIVGKLLNLTTSHGSTPLLALNYAYNQASDRLALQTDQASYDYLLDDSSRLIQESVNCFNEVAAGFSQGVLSGCQVDGDDIRLLRLTESFSGSSINCDQWILDSAGPGNGLELGENLSLGLEIRQNDGLYFLYPKGFANQIADSEPPLIDNFGLSGGVYAYAQNRQVLQAPLDIAVDFSELQAYSTSSFSFSLNLTPGDYLTGSNLGQVAIAITQGGPLSYVANFNGQALTGTYPTSDTTGSLRLQLSASGLLTFYYSDGLNPTTGLVNWVNPPGWQVSGFPTANLNLVLGFVSAYAISTSCFRNLRRLDEAGDFASQGSYTSCVYDAGQNVNWQHLDWTQTQPSNTTVAFQIAVSDSVDGPWNFVGPDNTSGTSYLQSNNQPASLYGTATYGSGTALATNSPVYGAARYGSSQYASAGAAGSTLIPLTGVEGRYARYQVTLQSGDGIQSPTFSDVRLWFGQTGMLASQLFRYAYDAAGNILGKTTVTPTATITDVRTVNDLNQILTQTVGEVEWTYTYNQKGAMISKTNGADTWIYSWNDENRLINVNGPNSVNVSFNYDSMGRMLSKASGITITTFIWDNWDCVAEITETSGNVASITNYLLPHGTLQSFQRNGVIYQIHFDALGSIRMVTDATGTVVARVELDAWGNCLSVTDNVPEGIPYRFVGAWGARWDNDLGMYYSRHRWYVPELQRWLNQDPLRSTNRYVYCKNLPHILIDPMGLKEITCDNARTALKGTKVPLWVFTLLLDNEKNNQQDLNKHSALFIGTDVSFLPSGARLDQAGQLHGWMPKLSGNRPYWWMVGYEESRRLYYQLSIDPGFFLPTTSSYHWLLVSELRGEATNLSNAANYLDFIASTMYPEQYKNNSLTVDEWINVDLVYGQLSSPNGPAEYKKFTPVQFSLSDRARYWRNLNRNPVKGSDDRACKSYPLHYDDTKNP